VLNDKAAIPAKLEAKHMLEHTLQPGTSALTRREFLSRCGMGMGRWDWPG
jgi:hypothetical protein